ncbi:ABC-F family ATP-binding cassette domain-containing protein [Pseudonocardia sp. MCCB 268]|nr:ABC-F family ATP-binding cassette domain-containing protein [Pseudonocardia cytotoxica]
MAENLLIFENVTAHVPGDASRVLLDAVSLGVERGDRIGVVGLNGGGKTTLLDVITGERSVEGGRISRVGGLRMALPVPARPVPAGSTVRDIVLRHYDADHEWASDPRVRDVLDGLGVAPSHGGSHGPIRSPITAQAARSGGSRYAALVGDLDSGRARRAYQPPRRRGDQLAGAAPGGLACRARRRHPRPLVPRHRLRTTWEVANGRVESLLGGYADWVYARAERVARPTAEQRRRNLARKELAWLPRLRPRGSKPRYRVEAAEALIADVPALRNTVELMQFATNRLGRTVLELRTRPPWSAASRTLLTG